MSQPRFAHLGGQVLGAAGKPVPLADALGLVRARGIAALEAETFGRRRLARLYARDAIALHAAASAAARWRKAAGWLDPMAADAFKSRPAAGPGVRQRIGAPRIRQKRYPASAPVDAG
jgi:hypothetical protein